MVHGKPRHPQSQGSVEHLNCDIKDILIAWLGDNHSGDWPNGIRFVQFQKNSSYHSGIKQSPYMALFGTEPRIGLRSNTLPLEVLQYLESEEQFTQLILRLHPMILILMTVPWSQITLSL